MLSKDKLRVSIVIPVYNEAAHLAACLAAIADQTTKPYEVIVVDNNSTDQTVAVAELFPFVKVYHESRQGVAYARDLGFNKAEGEIIGRLDADSLVAPDWVETLQHLFSENDELAAVSGKIRYYGMAMSWLLDNVDLRVRRRMARLLGREMSLQGSNMALKRSAWAAAYPHLCHKAGMHEDFDLALHLTERDYLVKFDERLVAATDTRRLESSWTDLCYYAWLNPKTYALHGRKSQRHMYPIVALAVVCLVPLKILHRGFNSATERFSLRQLLLSPATAARVNPGNFVD